MSLPGREPQQTYTEAPTGDVRRLCIDVRPRIKLEQTK